MERAFARSIESLESVFEMVSGFIAAARIDDASAYAIKLAVEELFVNMVRYNRLNANYIVIDLRRDQDRAIIRIADHEAEPFDITAAPQADVGESLETRRVGGLGIHLVRAVMDEVAFEHKAGRSTITLVKRLERADV